MPTARGGRANLPFDAGRKASSMTMTTTPITAPIPRSFQSMPPPRTPFASDEISDACGAARASGPAPGAPWKPKEFCISCSTGGMISAPKTTPMTSATCCFHGVAPTS